MLVLTASFALVAVIATADYITGYDIRLAVLYLLPIALATWQLGRLAGALVAITAVLCWIVTFESSHPYQHAFYFYWEGGITGITFLVLVALLARLREALARSDERFVTVLEGLDVAVQVQDARTGATLYDNPRYRQVFGGWPPFTQDSGEIRHDTANAWYLLQSRPLRWTDGRPAVLRMLSDITEQRRALELIAKHREAAYRSWRLVALGEFASAIAHELNQPLAAIATYNNACLLMLQKGGWQAGELEDAVRKCRDQATRAGAIIQRLREVLRQPSPTPAPQDLNEVARSVRELAANEAAEAGVVLELALALRLPAVHTDRLLIEQVALNLVRNAIEAVQDLPAERRRVTIATRAQPRGVALQVADLGEGVPPEVKDRLFEAFVTTKARGLGLGLSLCRSVVESLGGTILSEPNGARGARFSFELPAERA